MGLLLPWRVSGDQDSIMGQRVVLRVPTLEHFEQWSNVRLSSRSFLEPWEPAWANSDYSRASFRDRVSQYRKLAESDRSLSFYIFRKDSGTLCGGISLSNIRRGVAQMATLGYWIGADHARQGLMSDAVQYAGAPCIR